MTSLQYLKRFLASLPELSRQSGYGAARLAAAYAVSYIFHGANSEEFRALHLYEYNDRRRHGFLLYRDTVRVSDALNAGASPDELAVFDDKHLFNAAFSDLVRRDWLYLPESSPEQVRAFLARNPEFLAKLCVSTQGKGIEKLSAADTDAAALAERYAGQSVVLESLIRQHPVMAEPNPSTVNTLRIQTMRRGEKVELLGGCVRCGGAGAFVDNFHKGGVAYPLDMDTGVVVGPGRNLLGQIFRRHPSTGFYMPGFQVPHWQEAADAVRLACVRTEHVGYVGWDVAVTEAGPEIVEGNINYPDPIVAQLDGRGLRGKALAFAEGA